MQASECCPHGIDLLVKWLKARVEHDVGELARETAERVGALVAA